MIFRSFEAYPILFVNIRRLKISKTLPGKRIIAALLIEPYLYIILSNLDTQIDKKKGVLNRAGQVRTFRLFFKTFTNL